MALLYPGLNYIAKRDEDKEEEKERNAKKNGDSSVNDEFTENKWRDEDEDYGKEKEKSKNMKSFSIQSDQYFNLLS